MKNYESIDETFKALQQIPLEVSFTQVKKWVNELPLISRAKTPKSNWAILKSFFPPISKN